MRTPLPSFSDIVMHSAGPGGHGSDIEPLARLDYGKECAVKQAAFTEFLRNHRLDVSVNPLVPSPLPRHYRSTTKRIARPGPDGLRLLFSEQDRAAAVSVSALEPRFHGEIYQAVVAMSADAALRPAVTPLNFVVLRGSYDECAVIFNCFRADGRTVRSLGALSHRLMERFPVIASAFLFLDPSRSRFYLDNKEVDQGLKVKRLAGADRVYVRFARAKYSFGPTVFSQVNHAMVSVMLGKARELLKPSQSQHLVDLYCGYGLFSHYLSGEYSHVAGIESEPAAIQSAWDNCRWFKDEKRARFQACTITRQTLTAALPKRSCHDEALLVDPPRQGCAPGVIELLAARRPRRVLHICCGVDEIPRQMAQWTATGYTIESVNPLDMFPGTANLEVLVALKPR